MNPVSKTEVGIAADPDQKCACCGRWHRKVVRMSNGALMGERCADMVSRLSGAEGGFVATHWRNLLAGRGVPALTYVGGVA